MEETCYSSSHTVCFFLLSLFHYIVAMQASVLLYPKLGKIIQIMQQCLQLTVTIVKVVDIQSPRRPVGELLR
jgi:hypothetical protein